MTCKELSKILRKLNTSTDGFEDYKTYGSLCFEKKIRRIRSFIEKGRRSFEDLDDIKALVGARIIEEKVFVNTDIHLVDEFVEGLFDVMIEGGIFKPKKGDYPNLFNEKKFLTLQIIASYI